MHYCIIAAGEGSRLAQEGVSTPKPLVELEGRPMIGRLMDIFAGCNAESINVIYNPAMAEVGEFLRGYAEASPVKVNVISKSTPSSMHSLYELSKILEGDKFVVTTVDTVFRSEDMRRYVEAFEGRTDADALMAVTTYIDDESPLCVDVDEATMRITAFRDKLTADTRYVSGGIYGLTARAWDVLRRSVEGGLSRMRNYQRALIEEGLAVYAWDFGKIVDVDHAGDVAKAREFLAGVCTDKK